MSSTVRDRKNDRSYDRIILPHNILHVDIIITYVPLNTAERNRWKTLIGIIYVYLDWSLIAGVLGKDSEIPAVQRALTLEYLDKEYLRYKWILADTDGSAADAVCTGGSGSLLCHPEHQAATLSLAAGKICTNFRAEVEAI